MHSKQKTLLYRILLGAGTVFATLLLAFQQDVPGANKIQRALASQRNSIALSFGASHSNDDLSLESISTSRPLSAPKISVDWAPYALDTNLTPITELAVVACAFPPTVWSGEPDVF